MSGARQSSGGGVLIFLLAIAALVIVLGKGKSEKVGVPLGSLQLTVRSWAARAWDYVRSQDDRTTTMDDFTLRRLRQKEYLDKCEWTARVIEAIRVERRTWAKLQRESDRRMRSLERCPALLKAATKHLEGGESRGEGQMADLDNAAFILETLTAPTRASFAEPNGDYVPGEDVQSHLLKVQAWLDGMLSEVGTRTLGLTKVFQMLDSGSCVEIESE